MFVIYGTPNCIFCTRAKLLLTSHDKEFEYYDITTDISRRNELLALVPNMKTVPQIFLDDEYIGGFAELELLLPNNWRF